jgi:hypothetical protein
LGLHGFHDTKLTPIVKNAYHAISIHDQREWFRPTLMHFSTLGHEQQHLEQVWFPGMHGDVGGQEIGSNNNLISCHSLQWMMSRATERGLLFKPQPECDLTSKFIYEDSYDSSIVYKLMPREDRVIEKDETTKKYMRSQLYMDGQFYRFLSFDQVQLYQSKSVEIFYDHIDEEEQ